MASAAVFRLEGLSKSFGGFQAVRGVDLAVKEGEIRAVIGPNGAGKTTVVNLVSGLHKPTAGRIFLGERDITRLAPHRRARLGLVRTFQITSLFRGMTVAEHLRLAMRSTAPNGNGSDVGERIEALLADVGLAGMGARPVDTLSHGDQRILEVAMALASRPHLLLLDEPTAGMSVVETAGMIRLINQRLRGRISIMIIEHDMNVVSQTADRITVLAAGAVVTEGSPAEVLQDPHVREIYLGTPAARS